MLALIETKVGAPLSPADVRESVAHLVSLGRYDDVVVSKEESAGGLVVRYDLIPARVVHRIDFSGDVGLVFRHPATIGSRSTSAARRRLRGRAT